MNAPAADLVLLSETPEARRFTVANHHAFTLHETICLPVPSPPVGGCLVSANPARPIPLLQIESLPSQGSLARFELIIPPKSKLEFALVASLAPPPPDLPIRPTRFYASGLPSRIRLPCGRELSCFDLALVEMENPENTPDDDRLIAITQAMARERASPVVFRNTLTKSGAALVELHHEAVIEKANRYAISVVHRVYASGLIDVEVRLQTLSIRSPRVYLALAKLLDATPDEQALVRWKGSAMRLPAGSASPPRTLRCHAWSRDVSWLALAEDADGLWSQPLLARFTPGLVRLCSGTLRNANDYLINEFAMHDGHGWTLLAEIAREHRLTPNYVPVELEPPYPGETVTLAYRLPPPGRYSVAALDAALVAYAGHQAARRPDPDTLSLDYGVPGVSFGTSYFPHSTFGENFEFWRSAGLHGLNKPVDRWWPCFRHWDLFKNEIRRDLLIAASLGLDWIRLHHVDAPDPGLDYLQTEPGAWLRDYLEHMVGACRECGLGIFLDFALSPNDAAYVASCHGDVIRCYEIENEPLIIPGASPEVLPRWHETRRRILAERPEALVMISGGPQFYALHDAVESPGNQFNAAGQHAYVDRREAPSHFRDIALAFSGHSTRRGRVPVNSEFNWRMITRESEAEQAAHFEEITRNLLEASALPLLLQFQFQETFCIPPRALGALRHYELLRHDRTPKPQALTFRRLIEEHSPPEHRTRRLKIDIAPFELHPGQPCEYEIRLHNLDPEPACLELNAEAPSDFPALPPLLLVVEPGEVNIVRRTLLPPQSLAPGYHHVFEHVLHGEVRHVGWGWGSHRCQPRLDLETPPLERTLYHGGPETLAGINLSAFTGIVYGADAPSLEVEWAYYLYNSLRTASGADLIRCDDTTPPASTSTATILVGTISSNRQIARLVDWLPEAASCLHPDQGMVAVINRSGRQWLVVTGGDSDGVQRAASDLLYRYWRHAKTATSFRCGMPPAEGTWPTAEDGSTDSRVSTL